MAINPKDDYESLAKLLYPSIEASGNVYYGQTRKLTLDEVLKKNDLGFESHIESFRVDDGVYDYGFRYNSYFNWRLGPLKGSIRIKPFEGESFTFANFPDQYDSSTSSWAPIYVLDKEGNIKGHINADEFEPMSTSFGGALFAKYNIIKSSKKIDNRIHSGGLYETYESDISLEFNGLYLTNRCSPINDEAGVNNFYIDGLSLYIHIGTLGIFEYNEPLTITAKGSGTLTVELRMAGNVRSLNYNPSYDIKKSGEEWVTYNNWTFHSESDASRHVDNYYGRICSSYSVLVSLTLNGGESIRVKSNYPASGDENRYVYFNITTDTGNIEAILSGDISSMCGSIIHQSPGYRFNRMFCANPLITSASDLILSSIDAVGEYDFFDLFWHCTGLVEAPDMSNCTANRMSCVSMFDGCTSLVVPPKLPLKMDYPDDEPAYPYNSHFNYMFNGCTSLEESPVIGYTDTNLEECAMYMFYGCTSLKKVYCYAKPSSITSFIQTSITDGTFYCRTGTGDQWRNSNNTVPAGWSIVEEDYSESESDSDSHGCNLHFAEADEYNYSPDQLIVSGSNSQANGRGDITSTSTASNMENSFDENKTHKMNTYNADGSFNQDIWGYKSFNSPVQFRNGIYTDTSSLVDLHDSTLSGSKLHAPRKSIGSDSAVATSCYVPTEPVQDGKCNRACHSAMTVSMIDGVTYTSNHTENVITNSINNWSHVARTDTNMYPVRTACVYSAATAGKLRAESTEQIVYSTVMSSRADNNSAVIFAHATTDNSDVPSGLNGAKVTIAANVNHRAMAGVTCEATDDTSRTIIEGDELDIFSDELIIRPYEVVPIDNEYSLGTAENRFKELNVINSYSGTLNTDDIQPIGYNSFVINAVQSDGYVDGTSAMNDYSTAIQIIKELVEETTSSVSNAINQLRASSKQILLTRSRVTSSTMTVLHINSWITIRAARNKLAHNGDYIGYTTMSYDGYTSNVGSQSKPFDNVYAKSFNGVMPYYPYYLASNEDHGYGARGTQTIMPPLGSILTVRFISLSLTNVAQLDYLRYGSQIVRDSGANGWRIVNYGAGGDKGGSFFPPTLHSDISLALCDFTNPEASAFLGNDTEIVPQDGVAFTVLSVSSSTGVLLVMRIK